MGIFARTVTAIQKSISLLGRPAILRQQTGVVPEDPAKPWLGSVEIFTDTTVDMVFEPFRVDEVDDTLVLSGDVKIYVGTPSLGITQPAPGDSIIDNVQQWRIMRVLHFYPGVDDVAYELHVREF